MKEFFLQDFETIPKYSIPEIKKFEDESKYMDASVELLKQTIELLYEICGHIYHNIDGTPEKLNRDEAIIAGNLSRVIKLSVSFLQNICESKLEIASIISRCHAESLINLKYLVIDGEPNVKRNYIKNSLITEKELWNIILENIEERNGVKENIEARMQASIKRCFNKSDFELDEVNRSSGWKSIKARAKKVFTPKFYNIFYGMSSHSIHGNWQEIFSNNLNKEDGYFTINLEWNTPRPQIIEGTNILNLDLIKVLSQHLIDKTQNQEKITAIIKNWSNYQSDLIKYHEIFLNK
jgi:hypothetical protein